MPSNVKDRYGLTLSASSPAAAQLWQEGTDLILSQNFGPEAKFQAAVQQDEGFALGHAGLAFTQMLRFSPAEARASSEKAQELASDLSRRERQTVEAISLWTHGQGQICVGLIREHLAEFPRDALMLRLAQRLYMLGCSGAGDPNFPPALLELTQSLEPHCGDDWAFLGTYAFAHHENGYLSEALRLAERSLELCPTNAVAAHSITHVYFERGDAVTGGQVLGDWLPGFDRRAPYRVHLSWHQALFELAQGRYQSALDWYETEIRPSVVEKKIASLSDSASLLWRMQIYGGAPPPKPWTEVRDQAAPAADTPGAGFRDAHAALAFAGGGDQEAMSQLTQRLSEAARQGNLFAQEVVLPLAQGIDAFAQGNYTQAVSLLEPVFSQLPRIGGSHAQREVFEDTLLEAYLRAEQFEQAQEMLTTRLKQRESVRDTFWLGRVQAGQGQTQEAKVSVDQASRAWQGGDTANPEIANLNQLISTLG